MTTSKPNKPKIGRLPPPMATTPEAASHIVDDFIEGAAQKPDPDAGTAFARFDDEIRYQATSLLMTKREFTKLKYAAQIRHMSVQAYVRSLLLPSVLDDIARSSRGEPVRPLPEVK